MLQLTDAELVRRALAGHPGAFTALLGRHLEHVHRVVARRLRNPDDVLDVLQDTQLNLWRSLRGYDASRPFEAWLTCIAVNKCRDWARRGAVRTRLLQRAREHAALAGMTCAPEKVLIDREATYEVQRGLQRLPRPLREPLLLTSIGKLSHSEAGHALGITAKAVENRVRRARQLLEEWRATDDARAAQRSQTARPPAQARASTSASAAACARR